MENEDRNWKRVMIVEVWAASPKPNGTKKQAIIIKIVVVKQKGWYHAHEANFSFHTRKVTINNNMVNFISNGEKKAVASSFL